MEKAQRTPIEDTRKEALEHYEKISIEAGDWHSFVVKAIKAYNDSLDYRFNKTHEILMKEPPKKFSGLLSIINNNGENIMKREKVTSSNIESIGYDEEKEILEIEFINGSVYRYNNFPEIKFSSMIRSNSIGSYFHKVIKGNFKGYKVENEELKTIKKKFFEKSVTVNYIEYNVSDKEINIYLRNGGIVNLKNISDSFVNDIFRWESLEYKLEGK